MNNHLYGISSFFQKAIKQFAHINGNCKVLDFGCGSGQLVRELREAGYDAHGCDHWMGYDQIPQGDFFQMISMNPYKLPFPDDFFDVVLSTSVFEHAQNTEECFKEIHRVLKSGGASMQMFPGKWHLPSEPHIYIPFISWVWPYIPNWWLALWAFLGIRNEFQKGLPWHHVYEQNKFFCKHKICYRTTQYYERVSKKIFGNFQWPMPFFIDHSPGGFAALARKLPFKSLLGKISRECRMAFLISRK